MTNLDTNLLEGHNQILNTRLQVHVLEAQDVLATAVVEGEHLVGLGAASSILLGKLAGILFEVLADDVDQVLIAESACYNKESLVTSIGNLHGLDVCIGYVPHINPDKDTRLRDL
jgi:hypothetical protein